MTRKINIQIQTVLYENDKSALEKSLSSLSNALKKESLREEGVITEGRLIYGDASAEPLFLDSEIIELGGMLPDGFELKYRFFAENTGTAKGHNLLAETCDTDFMLIMNPDILVSPNFFEMMLEPFELYGKSVGLVEARQTPIEHPKEYDIDTGITNWASTAGALFQTRIFKEIGGFDYESFFMYCDDVDFSWRIRMLGKDIIYQPKAPIYHAKRLSVDGRWKSTTAEVYYSAEAALIMAHKWSNDTLCESLLLELQSSSEPLHKKAADSFLAKKNQGMLPVQLDRKHEIATFVDGGYARHKFTL